MVRIQFPEPDQAEKSADLVSRPALASLLGPPRNNVLITKYEMLEPSEVAVLSFHPRKVVLTQPLNSPRNKQQNFRPVP